jgi:peroxiredoxin Q/BCP
MVSSMNHRLAPGDTAPDFTLLDADGEQVSLADFAGHRVIVYFYPAAGLDVVGISPDSPEKLAQFRDQQSVAFPLLADPDKTTLHAYGAFGEKMLYGKLIEGVIRSTFVVDVDADGKGTIAVAQYNVKAAGHVDKLRRDLKV